MAGTVNISEFMMGRTRGVDDGLIIQEAIKYCWDYNKDTLIFDETENGEPMTYIVNSELCVYGDYTKFNSHFTIEGRDCILRKTKAFTRKDQNIHGALFNVYGLVKGMKYNGNIFNGDTRPARKITIKNLHLEFDPNVDFYKYPDDTDTNGFGICNAEIVKLENCTVSGAPQTDFAVVSSQIKSPIDGSFVSVNVKDILLEGCTGWNSRKHTFRLNAAYGSKYFTATMNNCNAYDTLGKDTAYGIKDMYVHLLCNNTSGGKGPFHFEVTNFNYNEPGIPVATGKCKGNVIGLDI